MDPIPNAMLYPTLPFLGMCMPDAIFSKEVLSPSVFEFQLPLPALVIVSQISNCPCQSW
jgi:hypothetical protein